jgi:hypothetical protein
MRHRHQGRRAADAVGRHGGRFPYRRHDAHHGASRIAEAAMTTCRRRTRALSRKAPAGQVPGDSSWPGCRATTAARACHGPPAHPLAKFYRSGDTGRSTRALTAHPARSVHEGCASVARRGTNLLAGRGTARTATAGTRPPSGERADGGLRTGRGPGTGEATPTHAPAGPFTRHGGLARPFPDDLPPAPCPLRG